ncbi:MAG: hypothetical protein M3P49_03395 [Actinomycetota bacterium]|nr:hypothetical protein [Actinomycetota bacterium]
MSRRRRRKKHTRQTRRFAYRRIMANLVRVVLVVLVALAIGYAFYLALRWVADEVDRRNSGAAMRSTEHPGKPIS